MLGLRKNNVNKNIVKLDWDYGSEEDFDKINKDELNNLLKYITPEIEKDLKKIIERLREEKRKYIEEEIREAENNKNHTC